MPHWTDGLEGVLHPTTPDAFIRHHWEDAPLVLEGRGREIFDGLLSLDELDQILTTTGLRYPTFRLIKQGKALPTQSYTVGPIEWGTGAVDAFINYENVRSLMRDGATLVLEAIQRSYEPLAELSRLFEKHLSCPAPINLYCTPPNAQGLLPHFDVQNVFVLQLHGSKHWKVYEPHMNRPLRNHANFGAVEPGELLHDVTLRPGDLLYMPRGFVHCAQTTDELSVHVSVSMIPYSWADVFRELINRLPEDVRFREAVPLQPAGPADCDEGLEARFTQLMTVLAEDSDLEDTLDAMGLRFVATRLPDTRGQLVALEPTDAITLASTLETKPGIIWRVEADTNHAHLHFHGKTTSFPWHALATVRWIANASRFTVGDIPGDLDDDTRCSLAQHLIDEGFLQRI